MRNIVSVFAWCLKMRYIKCPYTNIEFRDFTALSSVTSARHRLVVSVLECKPRGRVFKSQPEADIRFEILAAKDR